MNTLIVGIQAGTMPAEGKGNDGSFHLSNTSQFSSTITVTCYLPFDSNKAHICHCSPLQKEADEDGEEW